MSAIIRNVKESEYRITEEIIREAFWNNFQPGADEHFVLHNLRTSADSIQELDLVAEVDGRIVGSINTVGREVVNLLLRGGHAVDVIP